MLHILFLSEQMYEYSHSPPSSRMNILEALAPTTQTANNAERTNCLKKKIRVRPGFLGKGEGREGVGKAWKAVMHLQFWDSCLVRRVSLSATKLTPLRSRSEVQSDDLPLSVRPSVQSFPFPFFPSYPRPNCHRQEGRGGEGRRGWTTPVQERGQEKIGLTR